MATTRIHSCELKQYDLNDIDILLVVKLCIPLAVFLLPLSLSQSIILYIC